MRMLLSFLTALLLFAFSVWGEENESYEDLVDFLRGTSLSGLFYLSYQNGERSGDDYSELYIYRAYLTVKKSILSNLGARITFDTNQDKEGDGIGDMEVRLKYAYADFKLRDLGLVKKPHIEFGIVHTVWLDFEEHINLYRMREAMFMERSGIFNSADFGLTVTGDLGEPLDEDIRQKIGDNYAGKYGSFAVGMYNGGGYHAPENNLNKVVEGRLTLRPIQKIIPGLQFSGLAIRGKGNVSGISANIPDWETYAVLVSYQHSRVTFTGQYVFGQGNQKGSWTEALHPQKAADFSGYSFFAEGKLSPRWLSIAGYDYFKLDPNLPGDEFNRYFIGIGYDFGKRNILLVDYDFKDYIADSVSDDFRIQTTMQVSF